MNWLIFILIGFTVYRFSRSNWFGQKLTAQGLRQYLKGDEKRTLEKHFEYYRMLPPKSRRIFEYRLFRFRKLTTFVPREMEYISAEMEILISAAAVQIAFGFDDVLLAHFSRIIVYPDQFFSQTNKRYHKGEVNPKVGVIVLSWKHFVEGYAANEGVNLGLHEMAHALQLENIILNEETGFMNNDDIHEWQRLAAKEMPITLANDQSFFRNYAATNQAEFFAVAVENFFERPKAFRAYNSTLYNCMCRLLNQNPLFLLNQR